MREYLNSFGIDKYPKNGMYIHEERTHRDPWCEPPFVPPTNTPMLDDVIIMGERMIENNNRRHAADFPARQRMGQHVQNARAFGVRVSPLSMPGTVIPELVGGSLIAVSI